MYDISVCVKLVDVHFGDSRESWEPQKPISIECIIKPCEAYCSLKSEIALANPETL